MAALHSLHKPIAAVAAAAAPGHTPTVARRRRRRERSRVNASGRTPVVFLRTITLQQPVLLILSTDFIIFSTKFINFDT